MIPTKQTILHDPENGKWGNCLSAVIASLLHLPIEEIPVFSAPGPQWNRELNRWLRPFGLAYLMIAEFDRHCSYYGIEGCYSEISGPTQRSADVSHACVSRDGKVIFDPHPDDTGLTAIEGHGVFIALEPWNTLRAKGEQ